MVRFYHAAFSGFWIMLLLMNEKENVVKRNQKSMGFS
jgi:hypothetical protein